MQPRVLVFKRKQGSRILFREFLQHRLSKSWFPLLGFCLINGPPRYLLLQGGMWEAVLHLNYCQRGENVSKCDM